MRGQVSIEFLVSVSILFIFFAFFQILFLEWDMKTANARDFLLLQKLCSEISSSIFDANTPGYKSSLFFIPKTISGKNLTLKIYPNYVLLDLESKTINCLFLAKNVSYNASSPPFILPSGYYYTKNVDGEVVFNG